MDTVWLIFKAVLVALLFGGIAVAISLGLQKLRNSLDFWFSDRLDTQEFISIIIIVVSRFAISLITVEAFDDSDLVKKFYLGSHLLFYLGVGYFVVIEVLHLAVGWWKKATILETIKKALKFAQDEVENNEERAKLEMLFRSMDAPYEMNLPPGAIFDEEGPISVFDDILEQVEDPFSVEQIVEYFQENIGDIVAANSAQELELLVERIQRKQT